MYDALRCLSYLKEHISNCSFRKWNSSILDKLIEILLHILEYEIEDVIFSNNLLQFNDVGVVKFLQRLLEN